MSTSHFNVRSGRPAVGLSVLALAASLVIALAAVGCGSQAAPHEGGAPPPPDVSVAQVLSKQVRQWDEFTGRVSAVESVELRARVSGYVDRIAYKEGQEVKKGDLLFVIDQRRYRAELNRAQAQLEQARAEARLAQTQDKRAQTLVEAKAISREEFETRRAASTGGDAAVRAAEAAVASAQLDLTFTEVRSPINGRAGRAMVTVGNLASADQTILTSVVSQNPMYVYFESDEQTYLRYNELARKGEREGDKNPVRIGLASETGYPHKGTVDFTDNQVDPTTGTIRARAAGRQRRVQGHADRRQGRAHRPGPQVRLCARRQERRGAQGRGAGPDDRRPARDQLGPGADRQGHRPRRAEGVLPGHAGQSQAHRDGRSGARAGGAGRGGRGFVIAAR
jgi:multidrug efflux system membrane fusion protein